MSEEWHTALHRSHFDSVRAKAQPSVLSYARKEGLEREMNEMMVPGVGFEPTHPKVEVFETSASAIPPPGQSKL